jgi:CubicO group peptidase (beta-lactamase class C family)
VKNLNFKKTFELRIIKNNSIFHKKNIFFVILLSCALSIPLHSATKRKKGETKIPINPLSQKRDSLKDDMETTLSTAIQNSITKGGYISVLKDKITILEIGNKYNSETLLPVASLSKSFTALAILKLQEEGKLKLNDNISVFFPELITDENEENKLFTIRNLLQHHSGLPYEGEKSEFTFTMEKKDFTLPKQVASAGGRYIYSNYNYRLLGKVIEIASGESPSEYIKSKILDPLEITDYSFGETYDCSSGFFISPRHLLKYAGIFLQGGTYKGKGILEKKTFKKIFSRPNSQEKHNYYGLGWHVLTSEREKKVESLFHSGIGDYNFGQLRIFTRNKYIFFFQTEHTGKNRTEFNRLNKKLEFSLMKYILLDKKV